MFKPTHEQLEEIEKNIREAIGNDAEMLCECSAAGCELTAEGRERIALLGRIEIEMYFDKLHETAARAKPIAGLYFRKTQLLGIDVFSIRVAVTDRELCTIPANFPGAEAFADMFCRASRGELQENLRHIDEALTGMGARGISVSAKLADLQEQIVTYRQRAMAKRSAMPFVLAVVLLCLHITGCVQPMKAQNLESAKPAATATPTPARKPQTWEFCKPTPAQPTLKCIAEDENYNACQLGGCLPDSVPGLPSLQELARRTKG